MSAAERPSIEPTTVAVTGALGFVAGFLVPRLIAHGHRVVAIVRPGRDPARLERLGAEVRRADLVDPATHAGAFEGMAKVIHLAGMAQVPRFLPALERAGVTGGVFVGSTGIYTRLESPGADAKRAGEAALSASRLGFVIARPTMIYGTPADRNVVRLLRWLERTPWVPVPGGGHTLQQPVHVEDLTEAILCALERPQALRTAYDLGGPEAMPLRDLIEICATSLGRRAWLVPVPLAPSHRLVVLLRSLGLPTPVSGEQVLRLGESKAVDIAMAERDLEYRPRSFAAGIAGEVQLMRDQSRVASAPRDA